jgi:hypothetical protein
MSEHERMNYILTDEQLGVLGALAVLDMVDTVKAVKMLIASHTALRAERDELRSRCEVLEAASKVLGEAITAITYGNPSPEDFLIRRDEYWRNAVNSMREQSESHWHYLRRLDFEIAEVAWNEYITMLQASQQPDDGEA